MRRYFGTDGVRGVANRELTPELALSVARAAAWVLCGGKPEGKSLVVGRDPRLSGSMLEAAVIAGATSAGVGLRLLGVIPTPGVARIARELAVDGVAGGVVISASHNPVEDNGLKFFGADGFKLGDEVELAIEAAMDDAVVPRPTHAGVGIARDAHAERGRYINALVEAGGDLHRVRVIVDAAHGAAAGLVRDIFEPLGAEVRPMNDDADGARINVDCGATNLAPLRAAVMEANRSAGTRRFVGVAFDGDADRALFIDEAGETVMGDHVLWMLAREKQARGVLGDAVVGTSMTNVGLESALRGAGIELVRANVGDRYVIDAMRTRGLNLGAEASGHVVDFERGTTGDGPMTAVRVLSLVARAGSLSELAAPVKIAPQVIRNVRTDRGAEVMRDPALLEAIADARTELGLTGRVVVRPSGTEPVVRVMVEAPSGAQVEEIARRLCGVVQMADHQLTV